MSDIQLGLRTYLLAQPSVVALVAARIRPHRLPQNETMPAIVLEQFDTEHEHDLIGAAGLYMSRIRIDCYGVTQESSSILAETVRQVVHGYRGAMGAEFVESCQLDAVIKDAIRQKDASDLPLYRTRVSVRLMVQESIPSF